MDPILKAVLLSWSWRLEVILVLALAGTLYTRGWWRLRQRSRYAGKTYHSYTATRWRLANGWRLAAYWAGLFFILLALLSPIDSLGQQLFLMHMVQHLLLIMFAPPLLLLANPFPVVLWGLPDGWRRAAGRGLGIILHRQAVTRKLLRQITAVGLIWLIWVIGVIGWHDPGLYNWALRNEIVHDAEHWSFFLVSLLFWWHVIGAGPRLHKQASRAGRVGLLIAAIPANMLTGMVLAFTTTVFYTYYETVPRLWGIDPLADQRIGGIIMWVPGSMMFIVAALILAGQMVSGPKPAAPPRRRKKELRPAPNLESTR